MKLSVLASISSLGLAFAFPVTANATVVDFESYANGTNLPGFTNSGATFTATGSTTGFEISTYGSTWGTAAPRILCPRTAANYCGGNFDVSFSDLVNNLRFYFTGDDAATSLSVTAFNGATALGTLSVTGDGVNSTAHLVNLTGYGSISRIAVSGASADGAGFGYDDFSFDLAGSAVPEPATWVMMIAGFGLIGLTMRRRITTRTTFAA